MYRWTRSSESVLAKITEPSYHDGCKGSSPLRVDHGRGYDGDASSPPAAPRVAGDRSIGGGRRMSTTKKKKAAYTESHRSAESKSGSKGTPERRTGAVRKHAGKAVRDVMTPRVVAVTSVTFLPEEI